MAGYINDPQVGTVHGRTPGYDGNHDLGLAYSVVRVETGKIVWHSAKQDRDNYVDWIGHACCPPLGIMR
jgi:hypothetical protein